MVKLLPTMRETRVQTLGWEDLLEKEMATHSSILAWRIPWTEEPGRLLSMGVAESDTTEQFHWHWRKGASQGTLVVKNLLANAGDIRDVGSVSGLGRSSGEGNGNPLQYSCLENSMDRRAW